jgi:hypothetical protein
LAYIVKLSRIGFGLEEEPNEASYKEGGPSVFRRCKPKKLVEPRRRFVGFVSRPLACFLSSELNFLPQTEPES